MTAYSDTSYECLQCYKWWLPTVTQVDCLQWYKWTAYSDTSGLPTMTYVMTPYWHKWYLPTVTQVITAYSDTNDDSLRQPGCLLWHKWWLPTVTQVDCLQRPMWWLPSDTSDNCLQWHKWWQLTSAYDTWRLPTVTQVMTAWNGTCDDCLVRHMITAISEVCDNWLTWPTSDVTMPGVTYIKMLKIFTSALQAVNNTPVKSSRTSFSARAHSPSSYCE